jgi:hypothetical protein
MKQSISIFLVSMIFLSSGLWAQDNPPFIFTLSGGLFFPSKADFPQVYQSHSDLLWAVGVNLPVGSGLFAAGDYAFFKSRGYFNVGLDSTARYEQRIIHAGVLNKQPLSQKIFIRLTAGFNYVRVKQTSVSPRSSELIIETDPTIAYFGGIGIEQLLEDPHVSLFADAIYDYSRSHKKEFSGDFGGIRLVIGINLILF